MYTRSEYVAMECLNPSSLYDIACRLVMTSLVGRSSVLAFSLI